MRKYLKAFSSLAIAAGVLLVLPSVSSGTVHQISIEDFFFTPLNTRASVGDTVRWTNLGVAPHTSTSDNGVWASPTLTNGQSFQFQFTSPGTFPYHCAVHVFMKDTIRVVPTGINDESPLRPGGVELEQNYPNPFNAQTNIGFSLGIGGLTTLEVFDILGQRIAVLVDGDLPPGEHSYSWDGSDRSSGVFFCRLTFDGQSKTDRMVLLK